MGGGGVRKLGGLEPIRAVVGWKAGHAPTYVSSAWKEARAGKRENLYSHRANMQTGPLSVIQQCWPLGVETENLPCWMYWLKHNEIKWFDQGTHPYWNCWKINLSKQGASQGSSSNTKTSSLWWHSFPLGKTHLSKNTSLHLCQQSHWLRNILTWRELFAFELDLLHCRKKP